VSECTLEHAEQQGGNKMSCFHIPAHVAGVLKVTDNITAII
jgi:hypothetical protein